MSTPARTTSDGVSIPARLDPLGIFPAVTNACLRALNRPDRIARATAQLAVDTVEILTATAGLAQGFDVPPPVPPPPGDRRFSDPAWQQHPGYFALQQAYLMWCKYADALADAGRSGGPEDHKVDFILQLLEAAFAPTNYLVTNPDALVTAYRSGGRSLLRGSRMWWEDRLFNHGYPLKVDRSQFVVGKDLGATPGKVVYRNDLIELIQYLPQTEQVHEVPILASPPWINKYYVMDLAPGRSLFEWAIQHQRTVFAISYRNPDATMADLTMGDYLRKGPLAALDVVQEITGSPTVDLLCLCLGGALATMAAAWLQDESDVIGSITLTNTMLDYANPGVLAGMTDAQTLARLDERMAATGFLPAEDMSQTFDLLRSNDLVFNYVVSRWLKGEPPPPFDILAWNDDSTRMPAAMHSAYLRQLYLENQLAKGSYTIHGKTLDLGKVENDYYIVAAINDHIVPWTASYRSTQLLGGTGRFLLSSGGHIAGVVNPPTPKAWYEVLEGTGEGVPSDGEAPTYPPTEQQWRQLASRHKGSWWEDWVPWATARAGKLRKPPRLGSKTYPPICDAPGTYVL